MAIKKLQNNFTTLEQSKRLLELGVPADSADCYIYGYGHKWETPILIIQGDVSVEIFQNSNYLPCWSVGRLIQIFEICTGLVWQNEVIDGYTKIDILLEDFEDTENKYHFDFSKLED